MVVIPTMEGRRGWGVGQGDNQGKANDSWGATDHCLIAGSSNGGSNCNVSGDGGCGGGDCGSGSNSNSDISGGGSSSGGSDDNSKAVTMATKMAVLAATVTVAAMSKMMATAT